MMTTKTMTKNTNNKYKNLKRLGIKPELRKFNLNNKIKELALRALSFGVCNKSVLYIEDEPLDTNYKFFKLNNDESMSICVSDYYIWHGMSDLDIHALSNTPYFNGITIAKASFNPFLNKYTEFFAGSVIINMNTSLISDLKHPVRVLPFINKPNQYHIYWDEPGSLLRRAIYNDQYINRIDSLDFVYEQESNLLEWFNLDNKLNKRHDIENIFFRHHTQDLIAYVFGGIVVLYDLELNPLCIKNIDLKDWSPFFKFNIFEFADSYIKYRHIMTNYEKALDATIR